MNDFLDYAIHYSILGYDINLGSVYGKDSIKMTKRYSHVREAKVYCEQIQEHEQLRNTERLAQVLDWMYNDIKEQEKTKKYFEPYGN